MENKQKNKIIALVAGVLVIVFLAGFFTGRIKSPESGKQEAASAAQQENTTAEVSETVENSERKQKPENGMEVQSSSPEVKSGTEPVKEEAATGLIIALTCQGSWPKDAGTCYQYDITVENKTGREVADWRASIPVPADLKIEQYWNCTPELSDGKLMLTPADYARNIVSGGRAESIGIIVYTDSGTVLETCGIEAELKDGTKLQAESGAGMAQAQPASETGTAKGQGQTHAASETGTVKEQAQTGPGAIKAQKPAGALHVQGTVLADSAGNPVQLKGVSTLGLAWYPEYVNYEAFRTLRDDWGANTVRLAMYTRESGGYCQDGDREALKKLIDDGVNYTGQLGMYVIIDWHILSDGNPNTYKKDALEFFDEISEKYKDDTHVIYEICNEPQNSPWNSTIKPYAEEVIRVIRSHDEDAIILVGTNTWSQDVDEVIGNEIADENVMYTAHFYAATHKDNLRDKVQKAINAGIPVFISECSISDASGNGGLDYDSGEKWMELINGNHISYIAWSLCHKNETSALLQPSNTKTSGWTESDLSDTGKWFRSRMRGE